MPRTITGTLRDAIDIDGSYYMLAKADFYPSRMFFSSITYNQAVSGADAIGIQDDPMRQDIVYSATLNKLVTFWADTQLHYAVHGNSSTSNLGLTGCTIKPGVIGSTLFALDSTYIRRYTINWGSPITLSGPAVSVTPTHTPLAIHAVSSTECVVIEDDDGGFRVEYISSSTKYTSTYRFMFPIMMPYDKSTLTMLQQAIASGAAKFDNKIFVYMSNFSSGMVEGMYYDLDNGQWSDIFVVVPTDVDVSLCYFKIANVYEHNGTIYMAGQFVRLDAIDGDQPYSLILSSIDGKTFSIDRFTLVSDIGYRFLATVGSDNHLYLGNCNRVCVDDVTWVFDGATGTSGKKLSISIDEIKSITDTDLGKLTLELRGGEETYFDNDYVTAEARVILWAGMKTSIGDEYVQYGSYIIDQIDFQLASGVRGTSVFATSEAQWKLNGLSMPFYAEILGKSIHYDTLLKDTTELSPAGNVYFLKDSFGVDMWDHEEYSSDDTSPVTVGVDLHFNGGVDYKRASAGHTYGIIMSNEIQSVLGLAENPEITDTTVQVKIYGWSHAMTTLQDNDNISLVIITEDENGQETERYPGYTGMPAPRPSSPNDIYHWVQSWPDTIGPDAKHNYIITMDLTNLTAGDKIKKVGVIASSVYETWFYISRVEFVSGVQAKYIYYNGDSTWNMDADGSWTLPAPGRPFIMYAQRPYNVHSFSITAAFAHSVDGADCLTGYPVAVGLACFGMDNANYIAARYNETTSNVELVIARDSVETLIYSGSFSGTSNAPILRLDYKGGRFQLYSWIPTGEGYFDLLFEYEWGLADGVMFPDRVAAMKCGIYGIKGVPYTRSLGYYPGESEDQTNADGMPTDPLFALDDFPSSGKLRLGDDVYTYSSKIAHPSMPRGPFQYRSGSIAYTGPTGAGIEVRDFSYNAATDALDGYLAALNDGTSFLIHNTLWRVPDPATEYGPYYYNRTRYYSDNTQIASAHLNSNKVWVVGGFAGIVQINGTTVASKHPEGTMVAYEIPGSIKCYWYMGSGGEDDTVVQDMIDRVCRLSAVEPVFPGDTYIASLSADNLSLVTLPFSEGIDVSFTHGYDGEIDLVFNVAMNGEQQFWYVSHYTKKITLEGDNSITLKIYTTNSSGGYCDYVFEIWSEPSDTSMWIGYFRLPEVTNKFRIVLFDNNFSIYMNGNWLTSVPFYELTYGDDLVLGVDVAGLTTAITDINVKEFGDWREAIYIDLETDGQSAIGSILQQRYSEIYPLPDGTLRIFQDITRDSVTATREPRSHKYSYVVPQDGASDAIIYGPIEVKTMQNPNFARELGLSTKLFRMPDLTSGARRAVNLLLHRAYENISRHTLVIRPDLELTPGDIYSVSYTASGTGRVESRVIIVESLSFTFRMSGNKSNSSMTITGREYSA